MYKITIKDSKPIKLGPFTSSKKELIDLLKSWLAISLAFGIAIGGGYIALTSTNIFSLVGLSAIAVGLGFLVHELAHKIMAQKYHCWAEFRSFDNMLWLAMAMSLFGFVLAAPGAVMIRGRVTPDRNGKISLAGPLSNILIAMAFLAAGFFIAAEGFLMTLVNYGFMINTWLALFNLLPIGNFDGRKIWKWNKRAYIITAIAAGALFLLMFV